MNAAQKHKMVEARKDDTHGAQLDCALVKDITSGKSAFGRHTAGVESTWANLQRQKDVFVDSAGYFGGGVFGVMVK